ncbi:MAG: hypothetical protein E7603_06335 [Ruminococcaceae bacterium]|nr:hypothetical protein [Oscillospiraceae bacterium]
MYSYILDKDFLKQMRRVCSGIINQLVQEINKDSVMTVEAHLVGSGAKHLETQNENEPVDLDYNISILETKQFKIQEGRKIKEYIRKKFNAVLNVNGWGDCQDSTSALTTGRMRFRSNNQTAFSIDVGIVVERGDGWHRLIHKKTGDHTKDEYIWNKVRKSEDLTKKVDCLKKNNLWGELRKIYLDKKNLYLSRNDHNHPSFNIYIESVNEVYFKYFN